MEQVAFHEDTFYAYFKPYRHPQANWDIWDNIGLETFGEDLDLIRSLDPRYVWTVVDGDFRDEMWITPGYRLVNRQVYLITEVPHDLDIDVDSSFTPQNGGKHRYALLGEGIGRSPPSTPT